MMSRLSGLDPVVASVVDELIMQMRDKLGVTSIVVSHNITSIFRISDKIAMIHERTGAGNQERLQEIQELRQTLSCGSLSKAGRMGRLTLRAGRGHFPSPRPRKGDPLPQGERVGAQRAGEGLE